MDVPESLSTSPPMCMRLRVASSPLFPRPLRPCAHRMRSRPGMRSSSQIMSRVVQTV